MQWFKSIIDICNESQGFISAILTIMTIVISVIAIISSNRIGNIPYKKKLKAIPCVYQKDGNWMIDVMLINYGLMTLVIKSVSIKDAKKEFVGSSCVMEPIVLAPADCKTISIFIDDFNGLIEEHSMNLNKKITIEVQEYGGDTFKFRKGFPVG